MDLKNAFTIYIREQSSDGSNRASSYIRAIELLDSILRRKVAAALDVESIWTISSAEHVQRLYELVLKHQRLGQDGICWTDNAKTRLDPRNGLCLSATTDNAFDSSLITFDEDYRLVVSRDIREHYRNDHARELFEKRAGQMILMPEKQNRWPLQDFLEVHREKIV
ncbi:MAG: HNH endonuclease [Verrucomicrobia bacterium]|nr:HNH endonuclease [Verrucomicrobiota bacterium]MCH8512975.1 HNH endonuclease [Kiritimatiellia bacterium]